MIDPSDLNKLVQTLTHDTAQAETLRQRHYHQAVQQRDGLDRMTHDMFGRDVSTIPASLWPVGLNAETTYRFNIDGEIGTHDAEIALMKEIKLSYGEDMALTLSILESRIHIAMAYGESYNQLLFSSRFASLNPDFYSFMALRCRDRSISFFEENGERSYAGLTLLGDILFKNPDSEVASLFSKSDYDYVREAATGYYHDYRPSDPDNHHSMNDGFRHSIITWLLICDPSGGGRAIKALHSNRRLREGEKPAFTTHPIPTIF